MLQVARIPAGEFAMGADDGEDDERPAHKAYLDDFCIGTCPVTNAEYAQFVRETGHRSPAVRSLPPIRICLSRTFRPPVLLCWQVSRPSEARAMSTDSCLVLPWRPHT